MFDRNFFIILLLLCCLSAVPRDLGAQSSADSLLTLLGCGNCHFGVDANRALRSKAPDLTFAGEKYHPAYLFSFLQQPRKVRFYLQHARMPDFRLDPREALALTLFLSQQTSLRDKSERLTTITALLAQETAVLSSEARVLVNEAGCLQCHKLDGVGESKALELADAGMRLNREWVEKYLVSPQIYSVPETRMPSPFFVYDLQKTAYEPVMQFAAARIKKIAQFLFAQASDRRQKLQQAFERARAEAPEVSAADGQKIFMAQNCMACHRFDHSEPVLEKNAPDLRIEGARVRREWLVHYLQNPETLRPLGYFPGAYSRMPNFRLTSLEATALADTLMQKSALAGPLPAIPARQLSVFSMNKARTLLQDKLSCLGCHRLGETGGIIGPDLSALKSRLQPEYVFRMIDNPALTEPHAIMPRIAMSAKTRELIANYLVQQEVQAAPVAMPSLVDKAPYFYQQKSGAAALYAQHCAACHGLSGQGDGVNADYLPVTPTSHADAEYMSRRVDDTLFDGIYVGGLILGRSHFMPGFGEMLSREQIWELVAYMRQLCQCQQPSWARDNAAH